MLATAVAKPNFVELGKIEEQLLRSKLAAVRSSIEHSGEKGRSLESEVEKLLRDFLPAEYGLATGFVVWLSPDGPELSPQLDIIIYDAIRFKPLIQLGTCAVLPLEAVFAYVEVKASIRSSDAKEKPGDSLESCITQNSKIREMNMRYFIAPTNSSPASYELQAFKWISLRSYVFVFEASGVVAQDLSLFSQAMATAQKQAGPPAHIHGIYVANHGFFSTRPIDVSKALDEDYYHVRATADHPFLALKSALLVDLATFPRPDSTWIPPIDRYYEHVSNWSWEAPAS